MRLEYPFLDVPDADIAILSNDQEFFAGYFAPYTSVAKFEVDETESILHPSASVQHPL